MCEPQSNSASKVTGKEPNRFSALLLQFYVRLLHENKWMEVDQTLHWATYGN